MRDGLARGRIPMLLETILLYRSAALHCSVCGQNRVPVCGQNRGERSAAFLHLSACGQNQNRGVKGVRPSFTIRFVRGVKGARLASPLELWPKQRGERSTAFFQLSICGQSRGVKRARPSFTSRFVGQNRRGGYPHVSDVFSPVF